MDRVRGERAGLLLLAVSVAVMLVLGACGDSGDEAGGAGSGNASAATGDSADQAQVAKTMSDLRALYNRSDGQAFCARLTPNGRREVLGVRLNAKIKAKNCAGIVREYSRLVLANGEPQTVVDVRRVTIDGSKAKAVMTGGLAGVRRVVPFRLVKTDGEWKLDDPISGPSRVIRTDLSIPLNR